MGTLMLDADVFRYYFSWPLLIIASIALICFYFVVRRLYREKINLDAFQGNEAAKAMNKGRLKAEYLPVLGKVLFLAILLGLPLLLAAVFGAEILPVIFPVAFVVAGAVTFFCIRWSDSLKKHLRDNFKEAFVRPELAKAFANLRYEPDKAFAPKFIRELNFFTNFSGCSGNDLVDADYRGLHFTQFDMTVNERNTVGEVLHGAFKGRVMRFDFADSFRGKVQVLSKNFAGTAVTGSGDGWQRVETELADFGKYYEVYALDPLDAMAVLTPQMIEGIFYLKKAFAAPSAFYFTGKTMTVFLSLHRDAFDVSGKRTLLEESELLRHDIAVMTGFMDIMYFKRQTDAEVARPAAEVNRSTVAASVAAAAELSGTVGTTLRVERGKGMAQRCQRLFVKYWPLLIIAAYLAGTLYAFINGQGGFRWEFPVIGGAVIGVYILKERFVVATGILALYLLFVF